MGQKLKSAPVYFTIAQVRHNPILLLGDYVPQIQEHMRKAGYPVYKKDVSVVVSLNQQNGDDLKALQPSVNQSERLMFFSADNTKGFIVQQDALSFYTTEYDIFEVFTTEFLNGLSILHQCVTLNYSDRLGLRYLDAIVPPNGEDGLADYLAPGVLGLSSRLSDDVQVLNSFAETHILAPGCEVLARTIIRAGKLGFPMDLQPIGVQLAERFMDIDGVHAIVDTDASISARASIDPVAIKTQLDTLRKGVGVAFKAIVTAKALDDWAA